MEEESYQCDDRLSSLSIFKKGNLDLNCKQKSDQSSQDLRKFEQSESKNGDSWYFKISSNDGSYERDRTQSKTFSILED